MTARGDLHGFADDALERLGRSRRVVIALPDFGLLRHLLLDSDLLCTVSDALAEALVALNAGERRLAADPLPFAKEDWTVRMAWRGVLDHDPGEQWLRARIVETLAR